MIHFISGMPRAGSTVLSAILSQNQSLETGISSPLGELFNAVLPAMGASAESYPLLTEGDRRGVLRGIAQGLYGDDVFLDRSHRIDTSRFWCAHMDLIAEVFPRSRVIACVRNPAWVFDSLERIVRDNPLIASKMYPAEAAANVYTRAEYAMNHARGLIGYAWASTRDALFGRHRDRVLVVEYEDLARNPALVLDLIYGFLKLPAFGHQFEAVENLASVSDFDLALGLPGLHEVRRKVELIEEPTILPPDLFTKLLNVGMPHRHQ